jgi:hypothetical protein
MFFSVDDLLNDIESYVHESAKLDIPGAEAGRIPLRRLKDRVSYDGDEGCEGIRGSLRETRDYAYLTLFTPLDDSLEEVRGWTCRVNEQGRFDCLHARSGGWWDSAEDVEAVMRDRSHNTDEAPAKRRYPDDPQPVSSFHRGAKA